MKGLLKLIQSIIFSGYYQRYFRKMMLGDMREMIKQNPTLNTKHVEGEDKHIHKWGVLSKKISRIAYRIYSPFIGENDIDFKKIKFRIPNYEEVKQFAINVSLRIPHMSLFAHDIVLDKDNKPKLIEVNTQSFSYYFLQLTSGPIFGEYTDDIIQYCIDNKDKIRVKHIY